MAYLKKFIVLLLAFFIGCVFVAYRPTFGEGIKDTFSKIGNYTSNVYHKTERKLFKSVDEDTKTMEEVSK